VKKKLDSILKFIKETDMLLLSLCFVSTLYGIVLIDSATRSMENSSNVYIQVVALFIGIGLYVLFSLLDIDTIADRSKILYVLSIIFISTLFIWGTEGNTGNKAWLRFGAVGIQPAEIVKIPFTIILAKMISTHKDRRVLNTPISLLKIIGMFAGLFIFIMASSQDLGSALVYLFILAVVLFVGGIDVKWLLIGAVLLAVALLLAWKGFLTPLQKDRIMAPYDPSIDPTGLGVRWQTNQSKYAIAAGNFLGQGLFNGTMTQAGAVPKQYTDFIFSVAGEELGFVGCFVIVGLLMAIIIRTISVGIRSNSTTGMLVCTGFAAMLICQTFENIGMCLGLTPVIGLTLPFFSYGGSSIITLYAAMGVVSGIKMRPKPGRFRSYER
jgi:rod shape determining protein RodA